MSGRNWEKYNSGETAPRGQLRGRILWQAIRPTSAQPERAITREQRKGGRMVRSSRPNDPRALDAVRAIRETEAFLIEHLRHPERAVRIPVVRVGYGRFAPGLSEAFWSEVLALAG
jgi:hypothetical protein